MRLALLALLAACVPHATKPGPDPTTRSTDTGCAPADQAPPPPHVVLVILDDVGWTGPSGPRTSLGHGSDYHETPRLEALAAQGVAFSAAYASPQCQPARAGILTGQHAARTGMYANFESNRADPALRTLDAPPTLERLPLASVTVAELLGQAGWRTGFFGKWHIGAHGADGPEEQGFELNVGGTDAGSITGGSDGHFARADGSFAGLPNLGPNGKSQQFASERITEEAAVWLLADDKLPALAVVSHWSVHTPIQSPAEDLALFDGKPAGTHHGDPTYAGMLHDLDTNVGRLVDLLEQTEDPRRACDRLIDNTLLIVISDNGAAGGYASEGVSVAREISNQLPLRSGKGTLWEGGIRVPMVIRWDRGGASGRIVDQPVQHVDLLPTILDLLGLPDPVQPLDGTSLRPVLESAADPIDRDAVFFHFPAYLDYVDVGVTDRLRETPASAAWDGRHKLLWRYETASWELYDLETDLGERTNVAASNPDLVADLGQQLLDWLVATDAALPLYQGTTTTVPLPDPGATP